MCAENEKLRADARRAEMQTRIQPWKWVAGGMAAGAGLLAAMMASVAAVARYVL